MERLFARLDPVLWEAVGHNPKAVLRGVDQRRLEQAANDAAFLHDYDRVLAVYDEVIRAKASTGANAVSNQSAAVR